MKKCSKCGIDDSKKSFRKNGNQCLDCYNFVRRQGFKKKLDMEYSILEENNQNIKHREYKRQWYVKNKDKLSEQNKKYYLDNRIKRLNITKKNYYDENKICSYLLRGCKNRAKHMHMSCDLDKKFIEQLYEKQNGKCALTNIDFIFDKVNSSKRPFAPSIDRIDSNLEYTKNNVRLVCTIVNFALNEFGDQIFDIMCKAYVESHINA